MSLINEALKRADAEGPRRPEPLPPPPPVSHTRAAAATQPPPAAPTTETSRWQTVQTTVLGGALLAILVTGICLWKLTAGTPADLVAAPTVPASLTAAAAPPAAGKTLLKQTVPAASGPAASARGGVPPSPRTAAPPQSRPGASDLLATAASATPVKDVFASPPTLFLDARKSQAGAGGDLPLTPTDSRLATMDVAYPARLSSAFTTPPAGPPRPAEAKPAAPAGAPSAAAAPAPKPPRPAAEPPKLKVTSIFYNARAPTAIINGQVTGVGETIDGATVVAISPRSVEILFDGRRTTLRL
ncbi:MAG: hypothetical protein NTY65_10355 [Planctomycetota bacterium]|nr:hypothetical protein [Planctomycetota bacterium]